MTRDTFNPAVVRLSVRDWAGIIAVVFTILSAFFMGTISIERRLTEVIVQSEQLEGRIERLETAFDESRRSP